MQWRWSADRRRWWKPSRLTKAWEWTKSSCAGSIILQMPRLSVANSSPIWVERLAARQKSSGGPVSPELFSWVIPSQTGPNPRGFGDEMLSGLWRVPPLQVERRSAEMPSLRTEVQLDLGVGFGPTADCCQASAGGFV